MLLPLFFGWCPNVIADFIRSYLERNKSGSFSGKRFCSAFPHHFDCDCAGCIYTYVFLKKLFHNLMIENICINCYHNKQIKR